MTRQADCICHNAVNHSDWCLEPTPLEEWVKEAQCAKAIEEGKGFDSSVCQGCPVRPDCLAYAVRAKIRHGVWGGLEQRQLRQVIAGNKTIEEVLA